MHAESSRHFRRCCLTLLVLAAALAGWVSTADAQRSLTPKGKAIAARDAGDEFCVSTKVYARTSPSTAALKDGGFVVFWSYFDNTGETPSSIRGQRYDAAGNQVEGEFIVREPSPPLIPYSGALSMPFGAGLSDGGFVVTWAEAYPGIVNHIYAQRYDSAGAKVGSRFRINYIDHDSGRVAGGRGSAGVAGLKNGGFVVIWTIDSRPQGGSRYQHDYDVFAQRYSADGRRRGGNFRVNAVSQGFQFDASVAGLNNGGFVITWQSRDTFTVGSSPVGVYGRRYGPLGVPHGGEFKINPQAATYIAWSAVAALNDGFVVVWGHVKSQDWVDTDLYGRRYNLAGQPVGGLLQITDAREAAVSGLSDGGFVFTWSDWDVGSMSGRRYDASSAPVGPDFSVATSSLQGTPRYSSAAGLKDGGFAVTWATEGENYDYCGRVYSP